METVRNKPNFQGSFRTWYLTYSINREKGTSSRFVVFSSGRRHVVHEYLWLKLLWDELSKTEFLLFISMPETYSNIKILGFLQCRLILNKRLLRQRLIKMESLIGDTISSRERYRGLKRLRIDIQQESIRLKKTPKYSGYVRNISSIGRNSGGSSEILEPVSEEYKEIIDPLNWVEILSVGEFSLLSQEIFLPEEDQ